MSKNQNDSSRLDRLAVAHDDDEWTASLLSVAAFDASPEMAVHEDIERECQFLRDRLAESEARRRYLELLVLDNAQRELERSIEVQVREDNSVFSNLLVPSSSPARLCIADNAVRAAAVAAAAATVASVHSASSLSSVSPPSPSPPLASRASTVGVEQHDSTRKQHSPLRTSLHQLQQQQQPVRHYDAALLPEAINESIPQANDDDDQDDEDLSNAATSLSSAIAHQHGQVNSNSCTNSKPTHVKFLADDVVAAVDVQDFFAPPEAADSERFACRKRDFNDATRNGSTVSSSAAAASSPTFIPHEYDARSFAVVAFPSGSPSAPAAGRRHANTMMMMMMSAASIDISSTPSVAPMPSPPLSPLCVSLPSPFTRRFTADSAVQCADSRSSLHNDIAHINSTCDIGVGTSDRFEPPAAQFVGCGPAVVNSSIARGDASSTASAPLADSSPSALPKDRTTLQQRRPVENDHLNVTPSRRLTRGTILRNQRIATAKNLRSRSSSSSCSSRDKSVDFSPRRRRLQSRLAHPAWDRDSRPDHPPKADKTKQAIVDCFTGAFRDVVARSLLSAAVAENGVTSVAFGSPARRRSQTTASPGGATRLSRSQTSASPQRGANVREPRDARSAASVLATAASGSKNSPVPSANGGSINRGAMPPPPPESAPLAAAAAHEPSRARHLHVVAEDQTHANKRDVGRSQAPGKSRNPTALTETSQEEECRCTSDDNNVTIEDVNNRKNRKNSKITLCGKCGRRNPSNALFCAFCGSQCSPATGTAASPAARSARREET